MTGTELALQLYDWARHFQSGAFTVEDVQERFAALDISKEIVAPEFAAAVLRAQQELDAIRFGMCEEGQRGEIRRIFDELQQAIRKADCIRR